MVAANIAMISATYIIQRSHVGSLAQQDLSVLDMASKGSIVKRGEVFEVPLIGQVLTLNSLYLSAFSHQRLTLI